MSAHSPAHSERQDDDPIGVRYPNTARIWNYQLGGKDNFAVDRQASDAANAMVRGLGVPRPALPQRNTPLVSRSQADITRYFDGFTLVEPGLVTPSQWRPDLDNPLRTRMSGEDDEGQEPVIQPLFPDLPEDGRGVAWHFCGIGVKD
jgi:hypothetical protein